MALDALLAGAAWTAALREGVRTSDLGALQWLAAVARASQPANPPGPVGPLRPAAGAPLKAVVGTTQVLAPVVVDPEAAREFAAVLGDDSVAYHGPQAVAPPAFHARLLRDGLVALMQDPAVDADLVHLLHLDHAVRVARPLLPWEVVVPSVSLTTVAQKESGLLVRGQVVGCVAGLEVLAATSTFFVVGQQRLAPGTVLGAEPTRPGARPPARPPDRTQALSIPVGLAAAYAAVSGDDNPLHQDLTVARAAGFPACPVHGLATLGRATARVVRDAAFGDPRGIASIQACFRSPVFEGDALVLRTWLGDHPHFDLTRDDGTCVLSHGQLTFRS